MRIGELARRSGVTAKTIRFYESARLLRPPVRSANGYRDYDDTVMDRLAFIRAAQASGLTLAEIRTVVELRDRGEVPCEHVRELIDQRAAEIDRRLIELQRTRADLTRLAGRARQLDPADCDPTAVCHIITPTHQVADGMHSVIVRATKPTRTA